MGYTKVDISSLMHNHTILFPKKVAATALRQANNGLGQAVQLLQEQPDLIQVGCIGIFCTGRQYLLKSRPDNLKILRRELQVSFSLPSLKFNTFFSRSWLPRRGQVEVMKMTICRLDLLFGSFGSFYPAPHFSFCFIYLSKSHCDDGFRLGELGFCR